MNVFTKNITQGELRSRLAKAWSPNLYLTNVATAYFQGTPYGARELFPIVPVQLQSSHYYKFDKDELSRLQVKDKPSFGRVSPAQMGLADDVYSTKLRQIIVGIDLIDATNYQRVGAPGVSDPRVARSQFIAEQMNIELDVAFGNKFFNSAAWTNTLGGVDTTPSASQFLMFDDAASDPIGVIENAIEAVVKSARRRPNKIGLGYDVFKILKQHPEIVERIKYTGTSATPAVVTTNVLAQIFGVEKVVVFESTYNSAGEGVAANNTFICDSKGVLICFAPNAPSIDTPSAGYIFAWDMIGNGNWMALDQWLGDGGTHSEYVEGLMSYDMKKIADDCAVYLTSAVH